MYFVLKQRLIDFIWSYRNTYMCYLHVTVISNPVFLTPWLMTCLTPCLTAAAFYFARTHIIHVLLMIATFNKDCFPMHKPPTDLYNRSKVCYPLARAEVLCKV